MNKEKLIEWIKETIDSDHKSHGLRILRIKRRDKNE